jgi:hypothetical protein
MPKQRNRVLFPAPLPAENSDDLPALYSQGNVPQGLDHRALPATIHPQQNAPDALLTLHRKCLADVHAT